MRPSEEKYRYNHLLILSVHAVFSTGTLNYDDREIAPWRSRPIKNTMKSPVELLSAQGISTSDALTPYLKEPRVNAPTNLRAYNERGRSRIICVESDEDSRLMMEALLGLAGFEVCTASGIADGIELTTQGGYHLVTLDNWLKDGTGVELCRKIRSFDLETPIIFYSGLSSDSEQQRGINAGAQVYVIKPDIEKLLATVRRLTSANKFLTEHERLTASSQTLKHCSP